MNSLTSIRAICLTFACVFLIGGRPPCAHAVPGSLAGWQDAQGKWHSMNERPPANDNQPPPPPTAEQIQRQQAAEAERQQSIAAATAQNDQGIVAWNNGDWATAVACFQNSLRSEPNDMVVRGNLDRALEKINEQKTAADRRVFEADKQDALQSLKGVNNAGTFTPGLMLNDDSAAFGQLKAINAGDGNFGSPTKSSKGVNNAGTFSPGLKLNDDAAAFGQKNGPTNNSAAPPQPFIGSSVVDLRDIKNRTVDPTKLTTMASAAAQKLVSNLDYRKAINDGIAANAYGDAAGEQVALEKIRYLEGVQVPQSADLEFLFPDDLSPLQKNQIINGLALPVKDERLSAVLKEHPELRPELLAKWKKACDVRLRIAGPAMAEAVRKLTATAASLGLPYGHIEEAVAKDPKLNAEWQTAIHDAVLGEQMREDAEFFLSPEMDDFDNAAHKLREPAYHP